MAKKEDVKEIKAEIKKELNSEFNKNKILSMSEISLWLDTYDDLFSDFDPRPFSQRAVSVDFLDEIKRASREKASGQIELKFLMPDKLRSIETELNIKRRLREHFKKHYEELREEKAKVFKYGLFVAGIGFLFMFIAVLMNYLIENETLITILLTTLFEPAGWFMMFYGFDNAFYGVQEKRPEIEFYEKMSKAEISFISY